MTLSLLLTLFALAACTPLYGSYEWEEIRAPTSRTAQGSLSRGVFAGDSPGGRIGAVTAVYQTTAYIYGGFVGPFEGDLTFEDLWEYDGPTNAYRWWVGATSIGVDPPAVGTVPLNDWFLHSDYWPGSRCNGQLEYIASTSTLFLYGGWEWKWGKTDQGNTYGDLWEIDLQLPDPKVKVLHHNASVPTVAVMDSPCDGTFDSTSYPEGRGGAMWTRTSDPDILLLFGGEAERGARALNDVWEYNHNTNQFACWQTYSEDDSGNSSSSYGPTIRPHARVNFIYWRPVSTFDSTLASDDYYYIFGGFTHNDLGLSDTWVFNRNIHQWRYLTGPSTEDQAGVTGTPRVYSSSNRPYAISQGMGASWPGDVSSFYLYGGFDSTDKFRPQWFQFDIMKEEWRFVGGEMAGDVDTPQDSENAGSLFTSVILVDMSASEGWFLVIGGAYGWVVADASDAVFMWKGSMKCDNVSAYDSEACTGSRGLCVDYDVCDCFDPYYGENCLDFNCFNISHFDSNLVCSNHGDCLQPDICTCDDPDAYFGQNCSIWECHGLNTSDVGVCSGHGDCVDIDNCVCWNGYGGLTCNEWNCSDVNHTSRLGCSSHGDCEGPDFCGCDNSNYTGQFCENWDCFSIDHSLTSDVCGKGNGTCVAADHCECVTPSYMGHDCALWSCGTLPYTDPFTCAGHGDCAGPETCHCWNETRYSGTYCSDWYCHGTIKSSLDVCSGHGSCVDYDLCDCLHSPIGVDIQAFGPICEEIFDDGGAYFNDAGNQLALGYILPKANVPVPIQSLTWDCNAILDTATVNTLGEEALCSFGTRDDSVTALVIYLGTGATIVPGNPLGARSILTGGAVSVSSYASFNPESPTVQMRETESCNNGSLLVKAYSPDGRDLMYSWVVTDRNDSSMVAATGTSKYFVIPNTALNTETEYKVTLTATTFQGGVRTRYRFCTYMPIDPEIVSPGAQLTGADYVAIAFGATLLVTLSAVALLLLITTWCCVCGRRGQVKRAVDYELVDLGLKDASEVSGRRRRRRRRKKKKVKRNKKTNPDETVVPEIEVEEAGPKKSGPMDEDDYPKRERRVRKGNKKGGRRRRKKKPAEENETELNEVDPEDIQVEIEDDDTAQKAPPEALGVESIDPMEVNEEKSESQPDPEPEYDDSYDSEEEERRERRRRRRERKKKKNKLEEEADRASIFDDSQDDEPQPGIGLNLIAAMSDSDEDDEPLQLKLAPLGDDSDDGQDEQTPAEDKPPAEGDDDEDSDEYYRRRRRERKRRKKRRRRREYSSDEYGDDDRSGSGSEDGPQEVKLAVAEISDDDGGNFGVAIASDFSEDDSSSDGAINLGAGLASFSDSDDDAVV